MVIVKGWKYRLYPNKAQQQAISRNIDAAKAVYNQALYLKNQHYIDQLVQYADALCVPLEYNEDGTIDTSESALIRYDHAITKAICSNNCIDLVLYKKDSDTHKAGDIDYPNSKKAYKARGIGLEFTSKKVGLTDFTRGDNADYYQSVDSTAISGALRDLETAYRNAYNRLKKGFKPGFPVYKRRGYKDAATNLPNWKRVNGSYLTQATNHPHFTITPILNNNEVNQFLCNIKIAKIGNVKMRMHRPFPTGAKISVYARIIKTPSEEYYICFTVEYEEDDVQPCKSVSETPKAIGIDISLSNAYFGIASDGTKLKNLETDYTIQRLEYNLRHQQHKLKKMETGSQNWLKQQARIEKIRSKIQNKKQYFYHQKAKDLVKANDEIYLEDLDFAALRKKPVMVDDDVEIQQRDLDLLNKYHRADLDTLHDELRLLAQYRRILQNVPLARFVQDLIFEANKKHKSVVKVNRYYRSSQICSNCGKRNPNMAGIRNLKKRIFVCPNCGFVKGRDINAAINILNEGKRLKAKIS